MEKRILIVEDEQRLAEIIQKQLQDSGYWSEIAFDGHTGKKMIEKNNYDLVILDINLPLMNGYALCEEIRKVNGRIPVIMLTAFGTPENKLTGFEAGADDYVLKPFDFKELLARIRVFLKRSAYEDHENLLQIDDLEMDPVKKTVIRDGIKIELTTKEFALLELFLRNRDKILSREFISEKVWGLDFETGTNIIDVYINYLRRKVDSGFRTRLIRTKFGFGFYCSINEL